MADVAFWNDFHETIWERTPAHLGTSVTPLLSRDEVFRLAVNAGEALGRGDPLQIRYCDDGKRAELLTPNVESAQRLPQRSDRTLDGYDKRMSSLDSFFFRIPKIQLLHPALWPRLVRFTRNFYPKTGTPGLMAWTDAYFGRYVSTPFGVHLDGASNFTFGIDGHKTLYLWEPDFYEAHMRGAGPHDYEPFLADATKLVVGPGELIYWPGRFFHIAVPDGVFSVTVNFAFYAEDSRRAWLERAFRTIVTDADVPQGPFSDATVPKGLMGLCQSVAAKASSGALERELLRHVVEHTTRLGFLDPPPERFGASVRFETGDRVVLVRDVELVWVSDGNGAVIVSSNGYSAIVPASDTINEAMRVLQSGQRLIVDVETQSLVEQMHRWAAVERYWG